MLLFHRRALQQQLEQTYIAMALAAAAGRAFILPRFQCFCHQGPAPLPRCRAPGRDAAQFPEACAEGDVLAPLPEFAAEPARRGAPLDVLPHSAASGIDPVRALLCSCRALRKASALAGTGLAPSAPHPTIVTGPPLHLSTAERRAAAAPQCYHRVAGVCAPGAPHAPGPAAVLAAGGAGRRRRGAGCAAQPERHTPAALPGAVSARESMLRRSVGSSQLRGLLTCACPCRLPCSTSCGGSTCPTWAAPGTPLPAGTARVGWPAAGGSRLPAIAGAPQALHAGCNCHTCRSPLADPARQFDQRMSGAAQPWPAPSGGGLQQMGMTTGRKYSDKPDMKEGAACPAVATTAAAAGARRLRQQQRQEARQREQQRGRSQDWP